MNKSIFITCVLGAFFVDGQVKQADSLAYKNIEGVELFGGQKKTEGLQTLTRLPLPTRNQIQSISVISYKAIESLGGLSLTDVVKNVPGVTLFAKYGRNSESMSIRGYRGVPVLKDGVLFDSDFRTGSMLTDMQGVENIQIIKGAAALTQGVGNGLGSAGGVINIVTKKPQFIDHNQVGFRYGSWDFYRSTVDVQKVLDAEGKVGIRLNAAYQNNNSFRAHVEGERVYVNPSITFRPDKKTNIYLSMDYTYDMVTPDRGTVNLAAGDRQALYKMPKGKFLGFSEDFSKYKIFNFTSLLERKITDHLKIRTAYMSSSSDYSFEGMSIAPNGEKWNLRKRYYGKNKSQESNRVFQFDFIGQDIQTDFIKHTFQLGFDWKEADLKSYSFDVYKNAIHPDNLIGIQRNPQFRDQPLDIIDVLKDIPNNLSVNILYQNKGKSTTVTPSMGLMFQDAMSVGKYIKAHLGIRYSRLNGSTQKDVAIWNPSVGLMFTPVENINIFGSYTSSTSLRSANLLLQGGGRVGASNTHQWEAGIKSDWFHEKLRFNVTYFDINAKRLSYSVLNEKYEPVRDKNNNPLYGLAGNLSRKGLEVELIGSILPNLQIMSGWAYLDAQYQNSPSYVNGSRPMNAPKHTANAWLNYKFDHGCLEGFDVGAGIYYVGARPVDEWTQKSFTSAHINSVTPGKKPFDMPSYTTLDAQIGYVYKNIGARIFLNNILNVIAYNSYFRGGFIDQIQPRNYGLQLQYKF
ncbi:TonB-dependent receptor [Elizabethkingia argentiflava]|uniref:TonB-dependent receptor n=1 Tax=Elizabethkingia argenteiflava TaxID=2681556 RepID=A0A845PXV5_9FLAO|nr:TonB-dependent receptor [Elizabethkingia argenteiflava]NAW51188.1 TonB-dependent receptor [Elizabethkingia argenteiflava]